MPSRPVLCCAFALACCALLATSASSAPPIEADRSKEYTLTKERGPWMIMAATFTTNANAEKEGGKTKAEAEALAKELVLELRQLGMPAYMYQFDPGEEKVRTTTRNGQNEVRVNQKHYTSTCVLCGNYLDINDKVAQDSLKWIKQINPKCFKDQEVFRKTPGRPTPLSQSFLTTNPLLTEVEVEQMKLERLDPLLVDMNHGENHSLLENKGKYTLIVARFYGKQLIVQTHAQEQANSFLDSKDDVDLDNAAKSARELVTVLRGNYDKEATQFNKIDAYVWHDYHESLVTVGSFASENDPAIQLYKQRFGPKQKDFGGGISNFQPESLGVKGFGPRNDEPRLWVFEPEPQVMKVPRARGK